jgi:hypothetical protein
MLYCRYFNSITAPRGMVFKRGFVFAPTCFRRVPKKGVIKCMLLLSLAQTVRVQEGDNLNLENCPPKPVKMSR